MICYIALGSNMGDRKLNLEVAGQRLRDISPLNFRVSPIFVTPALLPLDAPADWQKTFLNAVVEIDWQESPIALLKFLKSIEHQMGRTFTGTWGPRVIDLDLVFFGREEVNEPDLTVPHPEFSKRSFVLGPLMHLAADFIPPGYSETIACLERKLKTHAPVFMDILNLTPDSFSDGGDLENLARLKDRADLVDQYHIPILDLGAESTRPGAANISPATEWQRLRPALQYLKERYKASLFRPKISVDTRHPETAAHALELGIDVINDVSGLQNEKMLNVLRDSHCDYVLMHSLSVPADPRKTLDLNEDPIKALKTWAQDKINEFERAGLSKRRLIFDPGIGFGKTAEQSFEIIRRIDELADLPVRILIGHSRKSFLKRMTGVEAHERDAESVGISLALSRSKVDILRVHNTTLHLRAQTAYLEALA